LELGLGTHPSLEQVVEWPVAQPIPIATLATLTKLFLQAMPQDLAYSFVDEVASKFCYDLDNKRLEIHFTGCWEIATKHYYEGPCCLLIHQWTDARCQDASYQGSNVLPRCIPLEAGMGIVSMLLSFQWIGQELELQVSTLDRRYLLLQFSNPSVEVVR
jgi:hypothetical protein